MMNKVKEEIEAMEQKALHTIFKKESVEIAVEGEIISLTEEDVLIEKQVHDGLIAACSGPITVALDTHITPELEKEGIAREIINKINIMRKNSGFEVTDRISISIETTQKVQDAFHIFETIIKKEVLATEVIFEKCPSGLEVDINGNPSLIKITQIAQTVK